MVRAVAMKNWNGSFVFLKWWSCKVPIPNWPTFLLKLPVALWASTKGGPRANVRHPGARWRHRAPWRCPVYPWAFWCQVTGLKIVQSWGHEWPTRMYFHMFISGAEAGKLIGKQGLELKNGWNSKLEHIANVFLFWCPSLYTALASISFWNMDIFSFYTEVPDWNKFGTCPSAKWTWVHSST